MQELAMLRTQVADLNAALEGLRAQLGSAQQQVSQVAEQLPERLGPRLEELEGTPRSEGTAPARAAEPAESGEAPAKPPVKRTRSSRTRKPGETP
jgi:DNA anti-recombination protein RmuC